MSEEFATPPADGETGPPLRDDARVYTASAPGGKTCRLIDNSGDALPEGELQDVLQRLIEAKLFGFRSLSASGGNAVNLECAECAHVQIGERLYRLILHRYEARIEPF